MNKRVLFLSFKSNKTHEWDDRNNQDQYKERKMLKKPSLLKPIKGPSLLSCVSASGAAGLRCVLSTPYIM
jgi:hypothetical protein